jgi:hypothetical protein
VLPPLGDLADLLPAEVNAFLEAVEAHLREGALELRVQLAELFVRPAFELMNQFRTRFTDKTIPQVINFAPRGEIWPRG